MNGCTFEMVEIFLVIIKLEAFEVIGKSTNWVQIELNVACFCCTPTHLDLDVVSILLWRGKPSMTPFPVLKQSMPFGLSHMSDGDCWHPMI